MRRAALAVLAVFAAVSAAAQVPDAAPPVPGTRSLYLLDVPFLHFAPMEVEAPPPGRLDIAFDAAYGNTFSHTWHAGAIQREFKSFGAEFSRADAETLHTRHPGDVIAFIDGEVTRLSLRGAVGLTRDLSVGLEIPYLSFGAIHLDGAIESFHRAFGLSDAQRDLRPRGRFEIVRQRPSGPLEFDDTTPEAGLGDVTASLRYRRRLSSGTWLSADAALKLPTGDADSYRGSGSVDAGLLAGAARTFGASERLGLRLEAGVVRPGSFRGHVPTTFRVSTFARFLLAADCRLGRRTFVSLAAVREDSPFRNDAVGDGALASMEVVLGVSRRLGPRGLATLSITENLPKFGDAADIAVALGFKLRP